MGAFRIVVFVSDHRSGKSLIAAQHFRRLAAGRELDATSAGPDPHPEVPPKLVQELFEDGVEFGKYWPRRLTRAQLATPSYVVSFDCSLAGLAPRGLPVEAWNDCPAVGEDFKAARDLSWLASCAC